METQMFVRVDADEQKIVYVYIQAEDGNRFWRNVVQFSISNAANSWKSKFYGEIHKIVGQDGLRQ